MNRSHEADIRSGKRVANRQCGRKRVLACTSTSATHGETTADLGAHMTANRMRRRH